MNRAIYPHVETDMPEQMWNLPSEVSNSTLRRTQAALDRDFRVAIDNNRADRRAGRGLAGGIKAPNTRGETRELRGATASVVNDRLRESRFGQIRVAWNWIRRMARRRDGREGGAAPYGRGDYASVGDARRSPITGEQVDRWTRSLDTGTLDKNDQRSLKSAIAAAYLVSRSPELRRAYENDPREMQNLAEIITAADRIASRSEPQPTSQNFLPPAQWQTSDPGHARSTPGQPHFLPGPSVATWASVNPLEQSPTIRPLQGETSIHHQPVPSEEELSQMLPRQRDGWAPVSNPYSDKARAARLASLGILAAASQRDNRGQHPVLPATPGPKANPSHPRR